MVPRCATFSIVCQMSRGFQVDEIEESIFVMTKDTAQPQVNQKADAQPGQATLKPHLGSGQPALYATRRVFLLSTRN